MPKIYRSEQGFSLLAILVGVTLVTYGLLQLLTLLSTSFKGMRHVQSASESVTLYSTIEALIRDGNLCASVLKNRQTPMRSPLFNPSGSIPTQDRLGAIVLGGAVMAKIGTPYASLEVVDMDLIEVDPVARTAISATLTQYFGKLSLTTQKRGFSDVPETVVRDLPLWIVTDSSLSHRVVACSATTAGTPAPPPPPPAAPPVAPRTTECRRRD